MVIIQFMQKKKNFFSSVKGLIRFKQAKLELKFSNSNFFLHNESYLLDSLTKKGQSLVFKDQNNGQFL